MVEKEEPDLTSDEWKELNKYPGYYISINGELYSKNGSEAEASRNTGIVQSEVSTSVLSNPHCVRGNYAFCYIEDDINDKNIVDHRKFRNILATHIETNETMKFVGQIEAAKELSMSISAV